ncbi:MAG TPA: hypothetical protein VFW05_10750 [Verrucomicrobiae bacterium]|jgi:hypothetical protein|nr:hypothetical protein [Verrucomicrobiae bacterium]
MSKPRSNSAKSSGRESENKFDALTGGQMQGRAGESLPSREETVVGRDEHWEHEDESITRKKSKIPKDKFIEIEYERGPGSKFEMEGLGRKPKKFRERKGSEE